MVIETQDKKHQITTVCDWFTYAPPAQGAAHWKDYRSAKELAKAWLRPAMPSELDTLFKSNSQFSGFVVNTVVPEFKIDLDNFGGPSVRDLLLLGEVDQAPAIATIEGKADESFGEYNVGDYYDRHFGGRSNIPMRVNTLVHTIFRRQLDDSVRKLRYQLLHASTATLIEAHSRNAKRAAFVVHEFLSSQTNPDNVARNSEDWNHFLSLLGLNPADTLLGPVSVPGFKDTEFFVGKVSIFLE